MSGLYDHDRLEKISRITPYFSSVAKVGDVVYRGLEGDPEFPVDWQHNRPTATITDITRSSEGIVLTMSSNGETFQVDEHSIAPKKVWEFTDDTFQNVLARERAEHSLMQDTSYRGTTQDLYDEIRQLRNDLEAEKSYNRDFHNVYIQSLSEIAKDIMGVESGTGTNFAKTFDQEYTRMRAENAMYRGSEEEEEEEDEVSDDASDNESAVGSLTDYF